jgi:hypothetical protein
MSTTSVSEFGYLFLTSPVCKSIGLDLDVRDHSAMDDIFGWCQILQQKIEICYYTKICDTLTITKV